jgi:hypothetical protein
MASGHVNRANRPNTWLHRPDLQREKVLANSEPSTHGTKRTFKVLRRRSDVEGRAHMVRTLPEGDPRYATDFYPEWMVQVAYQGAGGLRFMVALAAPLPGTYAGTRWTTLGYPEKVRSQFLSLRQLTQGGQSPNELAGKQAQ